MLILTDCCLYSFIAGLVWIDSPLLPEGGPVVLSETWLSDEIPDSAVAMNNFILFRNDRPSHAGGVGIYVNCKIPCKRLPNTSFQDLSQSHFGFNYDP